MKNNWIIDYLMEGKPDVRQENAAIEEPLFEIVRVPTTTGLYYNLYSLRAWNDSYFNFITDYVNHRCGTLRAFANQFQVHYPNFSDKDVLYYLMVYSQRLGIDVDIELISKKKWENLWFDGEVYQY